MGVTPFRIVIPEADVVNLRVRIAATNWPHDAANEDWSYGVNAAYLRSLADYWAHEFDWRAQERALNSFAHYRADVDGVPMHFIREPGVGPSPRPLVLTHGWPWTFWDYHNMIRPLADPGAFGGDPADAFDVIVVSQPGFAFSSPLERPGINAWLAADTIHTLMTRELGFARFFAHGGDWGASTTAQLGHAYPESLLGIHLTSAPLFTHWDTERPWDVTGGRTVPIDATPDQRARILGIQRRIASHVAVHVLDPQTLAYALHDSPVGLLAWLIERRRAWSDCDGDVERAFSRDFLLTTTCLYWFTNTFVTSARLYAEAARQPWRPRRESSPRVPVPTAVSYLAHDVAGHSPVAEAQFDIRHRVEHHRGGHFGPAEVPDLLVDDLRTAFRPLR